MAKTKEKKATWAGGTLDAFVSFHGTQRAASLVIGVPEATLNRWLKGKLHPKGLTLLRFKQLHIVVD